VECGFLRFPFRQRLSMLTGIVSLMSYSSISMHTDVFSSPVLFLHFDEPCWVFPLFAFWLAGAFGAVPCINWRLFWMEKWNA
jgi:hypothetical protein